MGKVENILLLKRRVMDFLEELKSRQEITLHQLEEELDELLGMDERVPAVLINLLPRTRDPVILDLIAYALEFAGDESIVGPLIELLVSRETSPEAKLRIISVLNAYGYDSFSPEVIGSDPKVAAELEELADRSFRETMEMAERDEESLSLILEEIERFPFEAKIDYIRYLADYASPGAVRVLQALGMVVGDDRIAEAAIESLSGIKLPAALTALRDLARRAPSEELRSLADRGARRLALMGIEENEQEEMRLGRVYKAILTSIDGNGDRIIWVCRFNRADPERLFFSSFMVNTDKGIRECFGTTKLHLTNFHAAYDKLKLSLSTAEVDYEYVVKLIKDALYQNLSSGCPAPYPFSVWRMIFADVDLTPQRYEIDLGRFGDLLSSGEEMLSQAPQLLKLNEFSDWYDHSHKAIEYYLMISKLRSRREAAKVIRRYVREVFEPKRKSLKRRLELMAEFMAMRGEERMARLALVAAMKLADETFPIHRHPLIAGMIGASLRLARAYLKRRGEG